MIFAFGTFIAATMPLQAHQAASGWVYDGACCGGRDCAQAAPGAIGRADTGWLVKPLRMTVPFDSGKIKESGDRYWHICIYNGRLQCLYKPPVEF